MKDSLKDFVDRNRDQFDSQEPTADIWSVIARSLPAGRRHLWNSVGVWRAAAAILLTLSGYLLATRNPGATTREMSHMQNDLTDLESYYRNQIAEKIGLIKDYDGAGENEQFTQDFQKLEAMYQVLSEEMKKHPNPKVKDALVLNLLVRIDLLNQQLKKLEDARKKHLPVPATTT
jgi:hypothetical protein